MKKLPIVSPKFFNILVKPCQKPLKKSPIDVPISLRLFPKSLKKPPIISPKEFKVSVKPFQKSLKKFPIDSASSLILSGIELTASQILSRMPVLSFPLSGLLGSVAPPPCSPPSVPPSGLEEELPEKVIYHQVQNYDYYLYDNHKYF